MPSNNFPSSGLLLSLSKYVHKNRLQMRKKTPTSDHLCMQRNCARAFYTQGCMNTPIWSMSICCFSLGICGTHHHIYICLATFTHWPVLSCVKRNIWKEARGIYIGKGISDLKPKKYPELVKRHKFEVLDTNILHGLICFSFSIFFLPYQFHVYIFLFFMLVLHCQFQDFSI